MPSLVSKGSVATLHATNILQSLWVGADLPVRIRVAREPVPQTAEPSDFLQRADFDAISFSVYRMVGRNDSLVEGYENVALEIDDVIGADADLPLEWAEDGIGYNFGHTVPADAFGPNAYHRVVYRFVVDGVENRHVVGLHVDGPAGEPATVGGGQVTGLPGAPGLPGFRPEFDVTRTEYGAIGDGTTDDRTAINAAIAAAEAVGNGAQVFFPPGKTYGIAGFVQVNASGNVQLVGPGAKLKQLGGGSGNQLLFVGKDNVLVDGLEIDGNYPTVSVSGDGIGINILAANTELRNVYVHATKGQGISEQVGSFNTWMRNIRVKDTGSNGIRLRGASARIHGFHIENWNTLGIVAGIRAIEADSLACDAEILEFFDGRCKLDTDPGFTDAILIDAADNDLTTGDRTPFGNSGAAAADGNAAVGTALKSYVQFTLDAGHGFQVGDSVWVDDSSVGTLYNAISHVIRSIGGTGNVFARRLSDTTLALYGTAEQARDIANTTGRVTLTDSGTGTTYINGVRGTRTTIASVDTVNSVITTAAAHGLITGVMVRLTRGAVNTVLPGGLADAGTITLNTPFVSAGTGATYMRPHRVRNVTFRNVTIDWHPSNSANCNGIKVNNVENLHFERVIIQHPPEFSGDDACSIRLGQGLRKVTMEACRLSGPVRNNILSYIPELRIKRCEIGDGGTAPLFAIQGLAAGSFSLEECTLRFSGSAIDVGVATSLTEANIVAWKIAHNLFEANSSSRAKIFNINDLAQLVTSGKVIYHDNTRRNIGSYAGLSITSSAAADEITTSTHHQLKTGDLVQIRTTNTLPGGTAANAWYHMRKTGDTTLKLYATEANAFADASPIDITAGSYSGATLWSPEIGVQFSNNGFRDYLFFQRGISGRDFISHVEPTSSVAAWRVGDQIWKMHPVAGQSLGWFCTSPGTPGTSPGTFVDMPTLGT